MFCAITLALPVSAVTVPATSASFAVIATPVLPVKLPVAVLVNLSDAFTPTLPVSAVTVPLFVIFVPFNTAFRFASTVPPFVKVSVAVNVTSVSVAVMLEPASVPISVALMVTEPASNLPALLTVTFKFSFPSAFLIARSFLPVTVVSTLSLPAPTFKVLSSNSIPILVLSA